MHPVAWWAWAAGVVALAGRTQAPVVLALLATAAVVLMATGRRAGRPAPGGYLLLAAGIIVVRLVFYVLVGIKVPGRVVLDLPSVAFAWAPGVQLLGSVTLEGLAAAATQGLALAVMIVAVGAAATASSPTALLRGLPGALHHLATAAVIAVGVVPSLAEAAGAAKRARRLRGLASTGPRAVAETALPVLAGALDRSLALAASMDSRGYSRLHTTADRRTVPALFAALVAAGVGVYGLLTAAPLWSVGLVVALGLGVWGMVLGRGQVRRTRLRVDRWDAWSIGTAAAGGALLLLAVAAPGLHLLGATLFAGVPVAVSAVRVVSPKVPAPTVWAEVTR